MAVKNYGSALRYVPDEFKTPELCFEAVKNDDLGTALEYVPKKFKTYDLYFEAVKKTGYALFCVPEDLRTQELCFEAINKRDKTGSALKYVPENLKTANLCLIAVKNGGSLKYVPEEFKSPEICLEAVKHSGYELEYVPEFFKTEELCAVAIKDNNRGFKYVPKKLRQKVKNVASKFKFSVISTGRGSNFEAIMRRVASGELNAKCISLITFKNCKAVEVAQKYNVPVRFIEGDNLFEILKSENPNLIVLSGYMRKIPENILEHFENKIINIHPSLLPAFGGKGCYGIHVHEKVIAAGVKITGVTVHFVNKEYDAGRIIVQVAVPVLPNDTPETLATRALKEEHNLYWQVIRYLAGNKQC